MPFPPQVNGEGTVCACNRGKDNIRRRDFIEIFIVICAEMENASEKDSVRGHSRSDKTNKQAPGTIAAVRGQLSKTRNYIFGTRNRALIQRVLIPAQTGFSIFWMSMNVTHVPSRHCGRG